MSRAGSSPVRALNFASSPLLASKTPPWRGRLLLACVALGFAVLLGRAVWVQVLHADFYRAQGDKRFVHKESLPASRGRIVDRNGLVLAASVALPSVQVDMRQFAATPEQRREMARLLGLKPAELDERLQGATGTVVLRRHLDEAVWRELQALKIRGLHEVREFARRYAEAESAAHVVGFTDIEDKGQEGIELAFQAQLQGRRGQRSVVRDRLGRVVDEIGDAAEPRHGRDVMLAVDAKVQFFAYQRVRDAVREHGARAGSVVVLDARSGEVLALANYPSFDPARREKLSGEQLRNRALTDIFEPGSTMKPFIAALALEQRRVTPATLIDTAPGRISITGSTISDHHPLGVIDVATAIQKSSNVATVKLAMPIPERELWEMYTAIGLGQKPQIDFPGAVTGRLRPHKSWRPIEKATMSYGYGLSASLFQLARAYTVFARDGELIPATILRRDEPASGQRVFSAQTAQQVREMLRAAAGPGGTAPKAMAVGYSVGGKTGTARKQVGRQYTNKYRSWFVGLAPVSDPRIVVAVMVDEPSKGQYYGGDVAAPVFSQVVQQTLRTLGVAPDLDVKAQFSVPPVAEVESY